MGSFLVYSGPTLLPSGCFFWLRFPEFLGAPNPPPLEICVLCSELSPVAGSKVSPACDWQPSMGFWLSEDLICLIYLSE